MNDGHSRKGEFRPRAVFFDLDGTLTDTMSFHLQAWTECLTERYGFALTPGDARTHAGKTRTILEALLELRIFLVSDFAQI